MIKPFITLACDICPLKPHKQCLDLNCIHKCASGLTQFDEQLILDMGFHPSIIIKAKEYITSLVKLQEEYNRSKLGM